MRDFENYIAAFFNRKKNNLEFSNSMSPKRVEIITIDLSTARTASNPLKISVPFRSVHVEKVYSTATPTTLVSGEAQLSFDYQSIGNIASSKLLSPNDAFTLDQSVAGAFITNTAQADTSMQIAFMIDIDYKAGSTKTSSVGTQSVLNTNATSMYNKPPIPNSFTAKYITATNANIYTCPAGKYAVINIACFLRSGGSGSILVDGVLLWGPTISATNDAMTHVGRITILAGSVVSFTLSSGVFGTSFGIEEYSV